MKERQSYKDAKIAPMYVPSFGMTLVILVVVFAICWAVLSFFLNLLTSSLAIQSATWPIFGVFFLIFIIWACRNDNKIKKDLHEWELKMSMEEMV